MSYSDNLFSLYIIQTHLRPIHCNWLSATQALLFSDVAIWQRVFLRLTFARWSVNLRLLPPCPSDVNNKINVCKKDCTCYFTHRNKLWNKQSKHNICIRILSTDVSPLQDEDLSIIVPDLPMFYVFCGRPKTTYLQVMQTQLNEKHVQTIEDATIEGKESKCG